MENVNNAEIKHLKAKDYLSYGLGLLGFYMLTGLLNTYQAEFYAGLGGNFTIIGIIILVTKVVSALFDPIVGNLIERTNSKWGKLKPFILICSAPLAVFTVLLFIPVKFAAAGMYVWVFIFTLIWTLIMTLGDVPSQGMASVITPNPTEKTNVISLANTFKSVGLVACVAIMPIICMIVPDGSAGFTGVAPISNTEYLISSIVLGVLGMVLFLLIFFGNKEKVPYVVEKMTYKEMFKAVKDNKPLKLVVLSTILGSARQIQTGIGVQAANVLIGNQNLALLLGIGTGAAAMVSMLLMPIIIKKFGEKKTYIWVSLYGFIISTIALIIFVFITKHIVIMLITLVFIGFQFGVVNIMPMVMTADCIDDYELKTGRRTEGVAYSVLTLIIKVSLALSTAIGLIFIGISNYKPETQYGFITDFALNKDNEFTKNMVFFAYAFLPGLFSLLSIIPILKYDISGEKKLNIAKELAKRREEKAAASAAVISEEG